MATTPTLPSELFDPRRAGQVTRYHTLPRIRDQSVGEHSWQVMRIMLAGWPNCTRTALIHALTHDCAEVITGDLPYPVKILAPGLRESLMFLEKQARDKMYANFGLPVEYKEIQQFELDYVKLCEYIEMWEWSAHESNLGNKYAMTVRLNCWTQMEEKIIELEKRGFTEITERISNYISHRIAYEQEITEGADPNV